MEFNAKQMAINEQWLNYGLDPQAATPESNMQRIASNGDRIRQLQQRVDANTMNIEGGLGQAKVNRATILRNADRIAQEHSKIEARHAEMRRNVQRLAASLGAPSSGFDPSARTSSLNPQVQ